MYKLLIVDDEEEVRKGILKKIEWNSYGFEIIGEAENGKEALEIAERTLPDVVLTDIKMPFMDGLELTKQLKEKLPIAKVIILTGFDEFEYAHKAISLNVIEYVLKPISSVDLIEVLTKTREKLDKEIEEKRNIDALRKHYIESLPILKGKFLTNLINNSMKKEDIIEKAKKFNINLKGDTLVVSNIKINYLKEDISFEEKEFLTFSMLNIIEEIVHKHNMGTAFTNEINVIIISNFNDMSRSKCVRELLRALEEIIQSIQKYLKLVITIGVGAFCSDITLISDSYKKSISALDYSVILGNNKVIFIDDIEPESKDKIIFDDLREQVLTSSLKVGGKEEIINALDLIFGEIITAKASIKDYQIYLMEVITTILKVAKRMDVNLSEILGDDNLFDSIDKFNHIEDLKEWLMQICLKIKEGIDKERQDSSKLLVSNAIDYINNNYTDRELSINNICSHLHISTAYFSSIFKKETKTTFVNYLTGVRMEAAKELLKTSNLKSFEIAEKVGYSEPNYFSYSFKKTFKLSPSEYRNG